MKTLGEALAVAAEASGEVCNTERVWAAALPDALWSRAPGWRPVVVIVSYLLASDSLDPAALVADVSRFLDRIGRGPVAVLCTNSPNQLAGAKFPAFRTALEAEGFEMVVDDVARLDVGTRERPLRYALLHRQRRGTLSLGGRS